MPGVESKIGARGGGRALRNIEAQAFFPMLTERGPSTGNAVAITSMAQFVATFGNAVAYSAGYWQVLMALAIGCPLVWVARVVGAGKTLGTLALKDGSAGAGTSTIRLDAKNSGSWSSEITVTITNGGVNSDDATTRTITIRFRVGAAGERVEVYKSLGTVAAIVAAINASSQLVVATDLVSGSGTPFPRALAATALSAGADDHASVANADMTAALSRFPVELGPGLVAIPGYALDDVGAALKTHAKAFRRTAYGSGDSADTAASTKTLVGALVEAAATDAGGRGTGAGFGYVRISDGTASGTLDISCEGFVAGVRGRTIDAIGVWQAPAGIFGDVDPGLIPGVVTDVDKATGDDLNANHVNAIRIIKNRVRNYGWRSLSANETFAGLHVQDTANAVDWYLREAFEDDVFTGIDDQDVLRNRLAFKAEAILTERFKGAFQKLKDDQGNLVDPGWLVEVTPEPEQQRMVVSVGIRPIGMAEVIFIAINVAATGNTL